MSTPCNALPSYVRLVSHAGSRFRLWWLDKLLRVQELTLENKLPYSSCATGRPGWILS